MNNLAVLLLLPIFFHCSGPAGPTVSPGFATTPVVTGLSLPTAMAFAPDGRLFVCEQGGALRVVTNDVLQQKPFLKVTVNSSGERGLLGIAFDPAFQSNKYLYVYYTATTPAIHNRVSRFTADGDTVLAGSEMVLLDLNDLSGATNHNGGATHFGPDGKLYIGVGENANGSNSQTLTNLLGKILRINSDGTIPTDNPFYNSATGMNRAIWALGLRNPFTFAFQSGTGRMFINDVGNSTWEEINDGNAGSNYGWPATEGFTSNPAYRGPLFEYGHGSGDSLGIAITGGAFYDPPTVNFPASYVGNYFFADYGNGWIRVFHPADSTARGFVTGLASVVDLQVSDDGSLYYLDRGNGGVVGRIRYTPTGIAQGDGATPGGFRLFQNFPNPFNPKTVISYSIPSMTGRDPRLSSAGDQPVSAVGNVVLRIFNVLGSEAAVLVNKRQSPGTYSLTFDASGLASGVYFYRLEYGGKVQTRTMVFLR